MRGAGQFNFCAERRILRLKHYGMENMCDFQGELRNVQGAQLNGEGVQLWRVPTQAIQLSPAKVALQGLTRHTCSIYTRNTLCVTHCRREVLRDALGG